MAAARSPFGDALRAALGRIVGFVARLWLFTLRVTVVVDPALDPSDSRPWVLAFFHGEQFALLAWPRRRPTVALVSLSKDGQIQSRALGAVGLRVERGSSSRGGARGLAAIVRRLRGGTEDAAFAVDGPRGPRGSVAEGAIAAARSACGVLVPIGSAAARAITFERAWDRFELPLPFTRVVVALGAPVEPTAGPGAVGCAIHAASALARRRVGMLASRPRCDTSSRSADAKSPST